MYSLLKSPLLVIPAILFMSVATFTYGEAPKISNHDREVSARVFVTPYYNYGYYRYGRPYYYRPYYNYYPYYRYNYRPYYNNYPYQHRPYYWRHRGGGGLYFRIN